MDNTANRSALHWQHFMHPSCLTVVFSPILLHCRLENYYASSISSSIMFSKAIKQSIYMLWKCRIQKTQVDIIKTCRTQFLLFNYLRHKFNIIHIASTHDTTTFWGNETTTNCSTSSGTVRVSFLTDSCILFPYLTRYHMTSFSKKKHSICCDKFRAMHAMTSQETVWQQAVAKQNV